MNFIKRFHVVLMQFTRRIIFITIFNAIYYYLTLVLLDNSLSFKSCEKYCKRREEAHAKRIYVHMYIQYLSTREKACGKSFKNKTKVIITVRLIDKKKFITPIIWRKVYEWSFTFLPSVYQQRKQVDK